jgi:transcriptional regulator with XRE-family HTH domain
MSDNEIKDTIAKNLSKARKESRYTQKEVAKKAGLNMNYYAKVERGTSTPSLKTLKKIAKAFKVTATDIVGF